MTTPFSLFFGDVIGMDLDRDVMLMVLAPDKAESKRYDRQVWNAVVLHDESLLATYWKVGQIITFTPSSTGITMICRAEDL